MIEQTIQEVKFEDIVLSKKQRQARKTNKLRHYLEYLNMLDENHSFDFKKSIILEMHKMFCLRQEFWIRQLTRVFKQSPLNQDKFQFAFLALEDGFYQNVAKLILENFEKSFNDQLLRTNYLIAKLEQLIEQFNHCDKICSSCYRLLVDIYIKSNNKKKIRQTYRRQIDMAFQNFDITYTRYTKWQESQGQINTEALNSLFNKAKSKWQIREIFLLQELPLMMSKQQAEFQVSLKQSKRLIKLALIFIENQNTQTLDKQKYLNLLSLLSNKQALWFLRKQALQPTHQLVQQYLQILQQQTDQQQVIFMYKVATRWEMSEQYQIGFLNYLVRRMNKHVIDVQSQDYNNNWGNNVEFFRQIIGEFISKQRLNTLLQKSLVEKYYHYWIQVQTSLVKDAQTVISIFENFLSWQQNQNIYLYYVKCMIRLNDIKKAKFIFKTTFNTYKTQMVLEQYQKFLNIYGSLDQILTLKKNSAYKAIKGSNKTNRLPSDNKTDNNTINNKAYEKNLYNNQAKHFFQQKSQNVVKKPESLKEKQDNIVCEQVIEYRQQKVQLQVTQVKKVSQQLKRPCPSVQQSPIPSKKIHCDQHNTLFSKNLISSTTKQDIINQIHYKQSIVQVRIQQRDGNRFCYVQFKDEQQAKKQLKDNKSSLGLMYSRPPSKNDQNTLFLCNLPIQTNKQQIIQLIPSQYKDSIKDLRIKEKHDKKMAYIQFQNQQIKDEVLNELKKSKIKIGQKTIIAMNCDSDNKNRDKKSKTIFLRSLSFKVNEDDLRKYFEQKGFHTLTDVMIPKELNNRSKGFAYIQFKITEEFDKALEMKVGNLQKRQFTIHRSDRAITHQHKKDKQPTKSKDKQVQKPKEKGKSNHFFSNIFN